MFTPLTLQPRIGARSCGKKAKARGRFSRRTSLLLLHRNLEAMLPRAALHEFWRGGLRQPWYTTHKTYETHSMTRIFLSRLCWGFLLLLVLDASAREPIPAPPKAEAATKTVRARDLGISFD